MTPERIKQIIDLRRRLVRLPVDIDRVSVKLDDIMLTVSVLTELITEVDSLRWDLADQAVQLIRLQPPIESQ